MKQLTRKEKKAQAYTSNIYLEKHHQFKVSNEDKQIIRRRKPKKYKKSLYSQNRTTYTFEKAESIFNRWLEVNRHRFPSELIAKTGNAFYFKGVIKNIELYINTTPEAMISYHYEGIYDDIAIEDTYIDTKYIEYIGMEAYHPQKGYYDADIVDEIYTYFPTREELYAKEVFEKIIDYCNKYITPQNSLYILTIRGSSSVSIDRTDESNLMSIGMQKDFANAKYIEGLSDEECEKLVAYGKAWRIMKYELFEEAKEPSVRYEYIKGDKS